MAKLEIIGAPQSTFVWQVRIAVQEKAVDYAYNPVRPHEPEVTAIHPFGLIPVMRHGDVALAESRAIAGYIDETFDGPALFPKKTAARAVTEQWVSLVNNVIQPRMRRYAFAHLFPQSEDGTVDRAEVEASLPAVQQGLQALDQRLAGRTALADDSFNYADAAILPQLHYMKALPESGKIMGECRALSAYFERHSERPSFVQTTPPPFGEG